jgi:hypothetical protein
MIGYDLNSAGQVFTAAAVYTNALFRGFASISLSTYDPIISAVLSPDAAYMFISAGLFTAAYICHRARRQERTGESIVFNGLKQVIIFLLSLTGGIIMLVMFFVIFSLSKKNTLGYIPAYGGFILGFALAYYIAQMIAEKTFNVGHKTPGLIKLGAVTAVLYCMMLLYTRFDLSGYQKYVPEPKEVTGVYIGNSAYADFSPLGNADWITDADVICSVTEAHMNIVSDLEALRKTTSYQFLLRWLDDNVETVNIVLLYYQLNDGSIVRREYYLPIATAERLGWHLLLKNDKVILSQNPVLLYPENIRRASIRAYKGRYAENMINGDLTLRSPDFMGAWTVTSSAGEKGFASLAEAVKMDLKEQYRRYEKAFATGTLPNPASEEIIEIIIEADLKIEPSTLSRGYVFNTGSQAVQLPQTVLNTSSGYAANISRYVGFLYGENTINWLLEHGYKPE